MTAPAYVAIIPQSPLVTRSSSSDSFAVTYLIDNQPGTRWRFAADFGFPPIDPDIQA